MAAAAAAAAAGGGSVAGGHEQSSSLSSGTVVSTAYTSSAGSRLSPILSMEAALHLGMGIHIHDDDDDDELVSCTWEAPEERKVKHIKSLVQEFFFGAQSANHSTTNTSVPGRWLVDLGVGWVLHLPNGACASAGVLLLDHNAGSWIGALKEIVDAAIALTDSLLPDGGAVMMGLELELPDICEGEAGEQDEEEEEEVEEEAAAESSAPDQFLQSARFFFQETMARMLPFVDAVVALNPSGLPAALLHRKMSILLLVRGALSDASSQIEDFISAPSAQVEGILGDMVSLLSAKHGEAREAIWSTLEGTRSRILRSMDQDDANKITQGPSGIHGVTWSVMDHVNFLLDNYSPLYPIVAEAAASSRSSLGQQDPRHLDSRIVEMVSCLEGKLASMSESFSDQGCRFLFLLNNSDLVREALHQYSTRHPSLHACVADLSAKAEGYMERYLQVSWAPLSACLFINPPPFCLFGKYFYPPAALPTKFESEFQKAYAAQKLWKVPDPELRRSLRVAIADKIIPAYTKYIDDNNISTPRIASRELEEMLQELFEG